MNAPGARISPAQPPYSAEESAVISAMMPPGSAADAPTLFRIFARNPALATAADAWGHYLLGRRFSLTRRQRELVIDRVCARCRDEYEWGLHIEHWASRVSLSEAETAALAHGPADDPVWPEPEALLLQVVDELHDRESLTDQTWRAASAQFDDAQLLDLIVLAGWYRAICLLNKTLRIPPEPRAARFPAPRPGAAG
jgi:4-carboxymuconolactone decarboxylase